MELINAERITVEQAVERIKSLELTTTRMVVQVLVRKFLVGEIVALIDVPRGERTEMFSELSKHTGIHHNQLRQWYKVYLHFGGSQSRFEDYICALSKPTEYAVFELIGASTDPSVLGEKQLAERTIKRVERLANDLEQINSMIEEGVVEREEVEPLMENLYDNLAKFKEQGFGKELTPRSAKHLEMVREIGCLITGSVECEAHHLEVKGKGIKGSDFSCIPLERSLHEELHQVGTREFERRYDVKTSELLARTLHIVLTGQDLKL